MQTIGSPILCQNQDVQDGWIIRIPARLFPHKMLDQIPVGRDELLRHFKP